MAYAFKITAVDADGDMLVYEIHETEAAPADEAGPIAVPKKGTIVGLTSELVAGAGTTVDPEMGKEAGWTTAKTGEVLAGSSAAPAAFVSDQTPVRYHAPDGQLFLRSKVDNAAADHEILTQLLIREGWEV
jgi:hypothetical protein